MNGINYNEYTQYNCEKCKDTYSARYARISDRTSCRYHYFIKINNEIICRDCKIVKGEHKRNCYHTSFAFNLYSKLLKGIDLSIMYVKTKFECVRHWFGRKCHQLLFQTIHD
jgi:hypothetical protein